jgi:glycosyltransferase involved in cell wall biosynthesis
LKVLFIHNNYRTTAPSGEDAVALNERSLLENNGINVVVYEKFNDDVDDSTFFKKVCLGFNYAWSRDTYYETLHLIRNARPDVAHIHSIFPLISPSVYAACQDVGVPVVHTLHNYRYICPGALLQRDGRPCEECVGRQPLSALRYRCYRGSLTATGSIAWMICYNRLRGTFAKDVNCYIALTEFAKSRLVAGGLPTNRIEVKPNFLPAIPSLSSQRGRYAVYVGRLSKEKGVETLLSAWRLISELPLKVLGDGSLRDELMSKAIEQDVNIEFMGAMSRDQVLSVVGSAFLQIVPSECYEGFPMVILEAYACGTPVIGSRIGSLAEVIHDGETGLHFKAGNAADLAGKVRILIANPALAAKMGQNARKVFEQKYTAERNFELLMGIYERACEDFDRHKQR